jgi:asparagine synthase (glutamine-hydrolysing)
MSAIAGLIRFGGAVVVPADLDAASNAIRHYGDDSSGVWAADGAALSAHLMHLSPESVHESQPLVRHGRVIVADARIDNRDELCDRFGIPPPDRSTVPDSELILRAFDAWEDACPQHLFGDFAFAIWDPQAKSLFCARDHIGARPLYYWRADRSIAFCTDIRGLLAMPGVPEVIDEDEVALYLRNPLRTSARNTFFRVISKLPFGCAMRISPDGIQEWRHWDPSGLPTLHLKSDEDYAAALRERVTQAVTARLRTTHPIGSHLSGGLDSSAVTVIAARHLRSHSRPLHTYSWSPSVSESFPEAERDERVRIAQLCRIDDLTPHFSDISVDDMRAFMARDPATYSTSGLVSEWMTLRAAKEHGVRTILSGWGGDEAATFNGRGYLSELFFTGRWQTLARLLRQHFGRNPAALARVGLFMILVPKLPDSVFAQLTRIVERRMPQALVSQSFAAPSPVFRGAARGLGREYGDVHRTRLGLYFHGHITDRMEAWSVWAADSGVVYSYPLADRRVMEFAYTIPPPLTWKNGHGRFIFRKAMEPFLPPDIAWATTKYDSAVERRRSRLKLDVWRRFAEEARNGDWDETECPWIDMPGLRQEMLRPPDSLAGRDLFRFVRLKSAVEMMSLWDHHAQTTRNNPI